MKSLLTLVGLAFVATSCAAAQPTALPTATATPAASPSATPSVTAAPTPSAASPVPSTSSGPARPSFPPITIKRRALGAFCIFVAIYHEEMGGYPRSLYWNIYDSVPDKYGPLTMAELTVFGTNADAPAQLALDREDPDWHFYLGFDDRGPKTIEAFTVTTSTGQLLDLTDALIRELGGPTIDTAISRPRTGSLEGLFANCPA